MSPIADSCNISKILTMGSEPVISSLNRANPFHRVCLFCNFVRNKIYVLEVEMLELVLLARYHNIDFGSKFSILGTNVLRI
jgi:hypothetical protein